MIKPRKPTDRRWVSEQAQGSIKEKPLARCTLTRRNNTWIYKCYICHCTHLDRSFWSLHKQLMSLSTADPRLLSHISFYLWWERENLTLVDRFSIWGRIQPKNGRSTWKWYFGKLGFGLLKASGLRQRSRPTPRYGTTCEVWGVCMRGVESSRAMDELREAYPSTTCWGNELGSCQGRGIVSIISNDVGGYWRPKSTNNETPTYSSKPLFPVRSPDFISA